MAVPPGNKLAGHREPIDCCAPALGADLRAFLCVCDLWHSQAALDPATTERW